MNGEKRIVAVGKSTKKIVVIGKPQRRIDPAEIAAALGAEPVGERIERGLDVIDLAEIGMRLLRNRRKDGDDEAG